MGKFKAFLKRKNIVITPKRYGVDALGAMAQGLFCSLLIGTIINTLGTQFHIEFLTRVVATLGSGDHQITYTVGGLASAMSGPAMAIAIGYALQAPSAGAVLPGHGRLRFQHAWAARAARWPCCSSPLSPPSWARPVSKETKVDILVTPLVTILVRRGAVLLPGPGRSAAAASSVGQLIMLGHRAAALPDGHRWCPCWWASP